MKRSECLTEDQIEQYLLSSTEDADAEEHLLLCPVCQDRIPGLASEIAEMKAILRGATPQHRLRLERRRQERHLTAKPVTLLADGRTICEGTARDRSHNGVCVIVSVPLRVGDRVQIKDEDQTSQGLVRYCFKYQALQYVGIQLT